jgi:hypothetical protein
MKSSPDDLEKLILEGSKGKPKKYPQIKADMPKGLVKPAEAKALIKFLKEDLQK